MTPSCAFTGWRTGAPKYISIFCSMLSILCFRQGELQYVLWLAGFTLPKICILACCPGFLGPCAFWGEPLLHFPFFLFWIALCSMITTWTKKEEKTNPYQLLQTYYFLKKYMALVSFTRNCGIMAETFPLLRESHSMIQNLVLKYGNFSHRHRTWFYCSSNMIFYWPLLERLIPTFHSIRPYVPLWNGDTYEKQWTNG